MPELASRVSFSSQYKVCTSPVPSPFRGPLLNHLEFKAFSSRTAAHEALKVGSVDLTDYPTLREGVTPDNTAAHACDLLGYYSAAYNCSAASTGRTEVRQAFNSLLAAARLLTVDRLGLGRDSIIEGVMPASYGWIINPYVKKYPPEQDRQLLPLGTLLAGHNPIVVAYDATDPIANTLCAELIELTRDTTVHLDLCPLTERDFPAAYRHEIEWHVLIAFTFVQDNLCRWNPGLTKLRTSIDWLCDFTSNNSSTRNYPRFSSPEFDSCASKFLACTVPHDLRPVGVLRTQLDFRWNNREFWEQGAPLPETADALLLSWKLQAILANESPVFPLLKPAYEFHVSDDLEGIFNADCSSGGPAYPGGIVSFWTFQRIHKRDSVAKPVRVGLSASPFPLNPLAIGTYQNTVIWARIYESLTGLNPILLALNVGEDCVNLCEKYVAEFVSHGPIKEVLTFVIPDGILWHDGNRFGVDDICFSILSLFGAEGREIAHRHPSTAHLATYLCNNVIVGGWIDLVKSLDHIEVEGDNCLKFHLNEASRYAQEWFGDVPMLPMHVWSELGPDFMRPTYRGKYGLESISRDGGAEPGFSVWNGLIGTGPYRWISGDDDQGVASMLRLAKFESYHGRAIP